jgi:hypothetical protein
MVILLWWNILEQVTEHMTVGVIVCNIFMLFFFFLAKVGLSFVVKTWFVNFYNRELLLLKNGPGYLQNRCCKFVEVKNGILECMR